MTDTTVTVRSRILGAVLVCSVFGGMMMCSMFVGGIASVNGVATEQDSASFMTNNITESSGSVVDVRVDLAGANSTTVTIEGRQNDYAANVTLYDTTDDGQITLSFDTARTGQNSSSFDTGGDDLLIRSDRSIDRSMAGAYDLELRSGNTTTDTALLTLQPTAIDSLTIRTAPSLDTLDTIDNVSAVATDDQTIATGDVMILQVSSTKLSDALDTDAESPVATTTTTTTTESDSGNESSPEMRLLELVRSGTIDIRIRQTNVTDTSKTFNLSATIENGGLDVLYDEESVYLLIDTKRAVFDREGTTVGIDSGDQFEATIGANGLENESSVSESVRIVPRTASFDTQTIDGRETIVVKPTANQTVAGETTVAPGTNLTIRAQANGQSPFVITRTIQVETDGTFDLDLDFTSVTKGISFVLSIPNQGFTDNASIPGLVRHPSTASVSVSNQNIKANGTQAVIIRSISLSEGGFVTVYDRTFFDNNNTTDPRDSLRGTSRYLEAGTHTNVSIRLDTPYANSSTIVAVPYLDTNGNKKFDLASNTSDASNGSDISDTSEDEPYSGADGGPIVNSANVSVNHENGPDIPTRFSNEPRDISPTILDSTNENRTNDNEKNSRATTDTGGNETGDTGDTGETGSTDTNTDDSEEPNTNRTTETEGPGFGLIVGLIAIVMALLAIRQSR